MALLNTIIGTSEWKTWLAEIKRTHKLYVPEFAPPEVVLEEKFSIKGLVILRENTDSIDEVGNIARAGQILFWYGDFTPDDTPITGGKWNAYDVLTNLYVVGPHNSDIVTQDEADADFQSAYERLEKLTSKAGA